jgi:hypothetical protein
VDEQVIAINTGNGKWSPIRTFQVISMKTFQVERSLSFRARHLQYDNGYLFVVKKGNLVGIMNVASGTFLRDIRIKPSVTYSVYNVIFRANSNYVVIATHDSKLYVYDFKCLKETDAVPSHLLLTTIDVECKIEAMMMTDTRIVCISQDDSYVVDLLPIDRLRCPDSC